MMGFAGVLIRGSFCRSILACCHAAKSAWTISIGVCRTLSFAGDKKCSRQKNVWPPFQVHLEGAIGDLGRLLGEFGCPELPVAQPKIRRDLPIFLWIPTPLWIDPGHLHIRQTEPCRFVLRIELKLLVKLGFGFLQFPGCMIVWPSMYASRTAAAQCKRLQVTPAKRLPTVTLK